MYILHAFSSFFGFFSIQALFSPTFLLSVSSLKNFLRIFIYPGFVSALFSLLFSNLKLQLTHFFLGTQVTSTQVV